MADVVLTADKRAERGSAAAGRLRRHGRIPAVVYGLDAEPVAVSVPGRELAHILAGESGANTLITLRLDGSEQLTLARQIQRHATRGEVLHVDFVRVRRDVAVAADVPVHLEGEAPGAREGGLLEQLLFTLTVEAKPADIPVAFPVDVSGLALGDQLHVRDLVVPAGVRLQHEPDELVVQVAVPRVAAVAEGEAAEGAEAEGAEGVEGAEGAPREGGEAVASPGGEERGASDASGE